MASTSRISETLPQFLVDVSGVMDEVEVIDVDASEEQQPDDVDEFEEGEWDDAETDTENDDGEMGESSESGILEHFLVIYAINTNLSMSMLGTMQQSQPLLQPPIQPTLHPTPPPLVEPTPQYTPQPHVQATSQPSGGRIMIGHNDTSPPHYAILLAMLQRGS
ncbi:hypothetical protein Cgig2_012596 [Carnegiea gigantea]|uniref:Uncharacterized protein n=1 Tax=Carnegiea gigantea TaxID=171969 RepID=A0A9Q1JYR7_9CARY|nr:hypothetical protein Cgig2_012596 [Carnegiea gigantea]